MTKYARRTKVPVDRSRAELERTIRRYGGTRFVSGWDQVQVLVGFEMHGRAVKISVPLPQDRNEDRRAAIERQRWRALILVVKAKLEAVDAGITTFEAEFLGHLVLATGRTVAELVVPRLDDLPRALPAPEGDVA